MIDAWKLTDVQVYRKASLDETKDLLSRAEMALFRHDLPMLGCDKTVGSETQ